MKPSILKLLFMFFIVVLIGAAVKIGATTPFFSDTETSTNNALSVADSFGPPIANHLVINEVYYDPDSSHKHPASADERDFEWIEIYNANDFDVTLVDWYIDDSANGGTTPKKISVNIPKKSYITIDFSASLFNNAGDSARLLDSSEIEKDYINYGEAETDYSFGRNDFSNHTVCVQLPTKAATNGTCIQVDEEPEQTTATPTHVQSVSPTKFITKKITPHALHNYYDDFKSNTKVSALKNFDKQKAETVLGETISIHNNSKPRSPVTHLTLLSMSYSILSIISLCVKIALA